MYPIEKYQFKTYEQKNEDGTTSTVVIAISTYAGKIVKGVAKCMSGDKFDIETGKRLAAARCNLKVCDKKVNRVGEKFANARKVLDDAEKCCDEMKQYYKDVYNEYFMAEKKLSDIESELK